MMKESESANNPMNYSGGTMYDKLKNLAEEMTEGIFNLSGTHVNRTDVQTELDQIAGIASREKSPEVVVNILLFRKYAEIANHLKESRHDQNSALSLIGELPSFVYENNDVELVGWTALGTKIFWLRFAVTILSFISFVVMSSVPNIAYADFKPSKTFFPSCDYSGMQGEFNYRPYQVLLALGVMVYLYNLIFAVYYILPADVNKHKFVPGLAKLLGNCISQDQADSYTLSGALFCKAFSTFTEMFLDALLLFMATITSVAASIILERSSQFTYTISGIAPTKTWFTIGSFYATFTNTSPVCVDEYHDPAAKIRASLAMMYLTLFFLALCLIVSATAFQKELKGGANRSLITSLSKSNADEGGAEEVVEFRALPSGDDDEGSHHGDRTMSV